MSRGLPLRLPDELPQDVREDPAVAECHEFLRRINPDHGIELYGAAVLTDCPDRQRAPRPEAVRNTLHLVAFAAVQSE